MKVSSLPRLCMGKNDQDDGKGEFFIKNAKEMVQTWKLSPN